MKLNELEILEDDFDLFVALDDSDKIEFLFDATQIGTEAAIIKQVTRLSEKWLPMPPAVQVTDYEVGPYRLSVTEFPDKLHINSNSLRAIKRFVEKLWNDGVLLRKVNEKKTEFDIYKYLRVYDVIGKVPPICSN